MFYYLFATVFSVFSFSKNKLNPNRPLMKKLLKSEICESCALFLGPTDVLKKLKSQIVQLLFIKGACQKKKRESAKLKTLDAKRVFKPTLNLLRHCYQLQSFEKKT